MQPWCAAELLRQQLPRRLDYSTPISPSENRLRGGDELADEPPPADPRLGVVADGEVVLGLQQGLQELADSTAGGPPPDVLALRDRVPLWARLLLAAAGRRAQHGGSRDGPRLPVLEPVSHGPSVPLGNANTRLPERYVRKRPT